ncbi:MaoC family dehydratase [Govanella unica]|uniref:MaoC family dehydratase n=1 Tax=Govanella unica TaxID=2975056 RepID=A0A9X3Z7G0_9PROT|nr:MaoC family dehydratase [Govania unica]MDA5193939.1 MaoC family dehydratase [Govania unica]
MAASGNSLYLEDLHVGQTASFEKMVTEGDIVKYAEVSGDTNPVHLDADYAAASPFKSRIAHGMLSAGLISAILGTRLPGPGTIYLSQNLKFKAPVRIGDHVVATAIITAIDEIKRRVTLATSCVVGDQVVIDGEAMVMVERRPA